MFIGGELCRVELVLWWCVVGVLVVVLFGLVYVVKSSCWLFG